jgi:E1A/CREB-binding protein
MDIGLTCCYQWVLVGFLYFVYHRNHIKEFIEVYFNKEDINRLVSSVYNYVNNPVYLAGCRALGIIDKLLTGPLWRIIENEEHILDLNDTWLVFKNSI